MEGNSIITALILGIASGAWAFLWCNVLTTSEMAGALFVRWYYKLVGWPEENKDWRYRMAKPLFDCSICHSFWVALLLGFYCSDGSGAAAIPRIFITVVAALFSAYVLNRKYE